MATVPREAATPSEALQLADVRMYAQKESRRASRDSRDYVELPGTVKVQRWPQATKGG